MGAEPPARTTSGAPRRREKAVARTPALPPAPGSSLLRDPVRPFGNLATSSAGPLKPSAEAHGFASRPRDRFALSGTDQNPTAGRSRPTCSGRARSKAKSPNGTVKRVAGFFGKVSRCRSAALCRGPATPDSEAGGPGSHDARGHRACVIPDGVLCGRIRRRRVPGRNRPHRCRAPGRDGQKTTIASAGRPPTAAGPRGGSKGKPDPAVGGRGPVVSARPRRGRRGSPGGVPGRVVTIHG